MWHTCTMVYYLATKVSNFALGQSGKKLSYIMENNSRQIFMVLSLCII